MDCARGTASFTQRPRAVTASHLLKFDAKSGERTVLFNKMPDGGWHEPGGPVFGPDGLVYFAQGSVAQQGIIEPAGLTVDIARHPEAHDIPGQDITLTGNNIWSYDPVIPYSDNVSTGAFRPYGVPAEKGEQIKGELWCSTGVYRARPDGTEPELLAWGIRNPYGLAFNEEGELYASDNDYEEKGNRRWAKILIGSGISRMRRSHTGLSVCPTGTGIPITPAMVFRFGTRSMPRIAAHRQNS